MVVHMLFEIEGRQARQPVVAKRKKARRGAVLPQCAGASPNCDEHLGHNFVT
jgi:hypothetical protein